MQLKNGPDAVMLWQRFETLTNRLLAVPKHEVKEHRPACGERHNKGKAAEGNHKK
jgi:hypothetical protein